MEKVEKQKAVFFDRDGIVNYRQVGIYINNSEDFRFCPDFFACFKVVKLKGYLAILITNQKGVGKGLMSVSELHKVHDFMQTEIKNNTGFLFDDIYYSVAPEFTDDSDLKPNPDMLFNAATKHNIDLNNSYMVGDRKSDIIAGQKAGTKTIFIGRLPENEIIDSDYKFLNLYNCIELFD